MRLLTILFALGASLAPAQTFNRYNGAWLAPHPGKPRPVQYPIPTVVLSMDASTPPSRDIVMGTPAVDLGHFNLMNGDNREGLLMKDLVFLDATEAPHPAVENLRLWIGNTLVGIADPPAPYLVGGWLYLFRFATPQPIIPLGGTTTLILRGDVPIDTTPILVENFLHAFGMPDGNFMLDLFGSASKLWANPYGSMVAPPIRIVRTPTPPQ